jgi:hypothetical protein
LNGFLIASTGVKIVGLLNFLAWFPNSAFFGLSGEETNISSDYCQLIAINHQRSLLSNQWHNGDMASVSNELYSTKDI